MQRAKMKSTATAYGVHCLALLMLSCCLATPSLALQPRLLDEIDGRTAYLTGEKELKRGNYKSAVDQFRIAEDKGVRISSSRYKLGISYMRLRDYEKSKYYFGKLMTSDTTRETAMLNLGLIEASTGNFDKASDWLENLKQHAENEELAERAAELLVRIDSLKHNIGRQKIQQQRWQSSIGLSTGYDQDIEDRIDHSSTEQGDSFNQIQASSRINATADINNPLYLELSTFTKKYETVDDNNYSQWRARIAKNLRNGNWLYTASMGLVDSKRGSEDYLSQQQYALSGTHYLSPQSRFRLGYRLNDIKAEDDGYARVAGKEHNLELYYYKDRPRSVMFLGLEFTRDERADYDSGPYFFSYSAKRPKLVSGMSLRFNSMFFNLSGEVEYSRYDDENRYVEDSALINKRREDLRLRGDVSTGYYLSPNITLMANYSHFKTQSEIKSYDNKRSIINFTISIKF